jgi:hypothetical protein
MNKQKTPKKSMGKDEQTNTNRRQNKQTNKHTKKLQGQEQ